MRRVFCGGKYFENYMTDSVSKIVKQFTSSKIGLDRNIEQIHERTSPDIRTKGHRVAQRGTS